MHFNAFFRGFLKLSKAVERLFRGHFKAVLDPRWKISCVARGPAAA